MHIILKTQVEQDIKSVFEGFDRELFIRLKPPGIGLKLLRFDGCRAGDIVELELNFGLFRQKWTSRITEFIENENEIYFVDEAEGKELPFFLSKWKHCHRIIKNGNGSDIVDDIHYSSPMGLTLLMYPAIWAQMAWRKPVYRKTFRKENLKNRQ